MQTTARNASDFRQRDGQIPSIDRNKWAVRALMTPAFQELYKHIYIRLLNVFFNSLSSLQLKCQQFVNYNFVNIWKG